MSALFPFGAKPLGFSKETIEYELQHAAKLHNKNRGELAELAFMRKAASLGFSVAKPWGESERYDVVVRSERVFWRVQIKSVWRMAPTRGHYRVRTINCLEICYTPDEIDFLVAYVFHEHSWYVFPVSIIGNRKAVFITPGSTKSRYEQYREAWKLMRAGISESADGETGGQAKPAAADAAPAELVQLLL